MSSGAHSSGVSGHRLPLKPPHSLLDGVDLAKPLCSGYVFKQAHTHVVFHRRYFVLFPKVLVYYEKEADYHKDVPRGKLEVYIESGRGYYSICALAGEGWRGPVTIACVG